MRRLDDVINQLLIVIPESNVQLIYELKDIRGSVNLTAPELMQERWYEAHDSLISNVPDMPTEDWQWKMFSIFSTKSVDELKEMWKEEE